AHDRDRARDRGRARPGGLRSAPRDRPVPGAARGTGVPVVAARRGRGDPDRVRDDRERSRQGRDALRCPSHRGPGRGRRSRRIRTVHADRPGRRVSVRFDDLEVGRDLPSSSRLVTLEDVKAYADASGDQNPLHQDDEVARAAGFPRVVAHGMYTMGTLTSWLVDWLGDPAGLLRLQVHFPAPGLVRESIECGGRVRSVDPQTRTAVLEVWVRVERDGADVWPIRKSEAEVRLD